MAIKGENPLLFKEADISLEVVILIIGGMAMLISGLLLFPVYYGFLPYYENGLFGLLIIIFSMQMIMLGKTPFGDMTRSIPLIAAGVLIALAGMVTSFIPIANIFPRLLLFLCFGPGGLFLLVKMCFAKDKLRSWVKNGGIFWQLIFLCALTYVFSMLTGVILLRQNLFATPVIAVVVLLFGMVILYLAVVLWKIYGRYPEAKIQPVGSVALSTDQAMLILMGTFMIILGILLIPVSLGLLPFSGSAQLGLLLVIFAIQMLAFGGTPIGVFSRSWLLIFFGLLFAALGIVSCIIPDILVVLLTVLVGVLNIFGGMISLVKIGVQKFQQKNKGPIPPILVRLFATQLVLNLLSITFGTSMLLPGLVHGLVIGVILAANGCVLLYLLSILIKLDKIRAGMHK